MTSKMHICLLSYEFPPMRGGEGSYTYGLLKSLSGMGQDVRVITTGTKWRESEVIRVPVINHFPLKLYSFCRQVKKEIMKMEKKKEIDVLHYTNDYYNINIPKISAPIVVTIHHPYVVERRIVKKELCNAGYIRYLYSRRIHLVARAEKKMCKKADRIIAVSNYTAQSIAREYHIPFENITIIPNAVDIERFNPSVNGEYIKEKRALTSEHIILFVGRLDNTKGIRYLLEGFSKIVKDFPDAKLVIVGKGVLKQFILTYVTRNNLKNSVMLIEEVPEDDLPKLYAAADVVVLPSLIEGFGIVLLEAMAAMKPCVATRAGGTEDAIIDEKTGFLIPPADSNSLYDAIYAILSDEKLSQRFGFAGRKRVEKNFTWDKVAKRTLDLYREIGNHSNLNVPIGL